MLSTAIEPSGETQFRFAGLSQNEIARTGAVAAGNQFGARAFVAHVDVPGFVAVGFGQRFVRGEEDLVAIGRAAREDARRVRRCRRSGPRETSTAPPPVQS